MMQMMQMIKTQKEKEKYGVRCEINRLTSGLLRSHAHRSYSPFTDEHAFTILHQRSSKLCQTKASYVRGLAYNKKQKENVYICIVDTLKIRRNGFALMKGQ